MDDKTYAKMIDIENISVAVVDKDKSSVLTLQVLSMIKESQLQHGMRHGDHQRYRQYCARRLKRIRHSLHFPAGSKYQVSKKKVKEENLNDVRFIYISLVECERAWAYAMQLKLEANTEHRKGHHMKQRMKKAVTHAETLNNLCAGNRVDACTKLEAEAYSSWMKATLAFECENWKGAMELFTKSKTIYEKLSGAFVDEQRQIYSNRVDEIAPSIRYCAYSIGDESAIQDLRQMRGKTGLGDNMMMQLDELIEKTREKQAATLSEVEWRGRVIPVRNEYVRVFLLTVQELEQQLAGLDTIEGKLSIYETLTNELMTAQQSLRDELREDPQAKAILKGQLPENGRVPNSIYLHTYLMFLKHTKTVERTMLMIQSLHNASKTKHTDQHYKPLKAPDVARLYDIIVSNLTDIVSLPGIDDGVLFDEVDAQTMGYRAFRCFYIAKSCAGEKRWKEAIALYERVSEYCAEALKLLRNVKQVHCNDKQELMDSIETLITEVEGVKYSVHASSILDVDNISDSIVTLSLKNSKPLIERLDEYVIDTSLNTKPHLSHFPPDFEPVPCKPLFFDLALNHVQFPSFKDHFDGSKKGSGLTGMVKGWLWGK